MWVHRVVFAVVGLLPLRPRRGFDVRARCSTTAVARSKTRRGHSSPPQRSLGQPVRVDLARYQGVFWARYDRTDRPVGGNGYLDGALADPPPGVIDTARDRGSDAVTWQPSTGLRFAIVAQREPDGEVLMAGQSLSRTEERAAQALIITISVLIAGAVVTVAGVAVSAVAAGDSAEGGRITPA